MKFKLLSVLAFVFICSQSFGAELFLRNGWPGEYRTVIEVKKDTTIMLRDDFNLASPQNIQCNLENGTKFADNFYNTVFKREKVILEATQESTFDLVIHKNDGSGKFNIEKLVVPKRGKVVELTYYAEGICGYKFGNRYFEYTCIDVESSAFKLLSDEQPNWADLRQEEWMFILCEENSGWLLLNDIEPIHDEIDPVFAISFDLDFW